MQVLDNKTSISISLSASTVGSYTCRVTVKGYKEITSTAKVYMFGPPKILTSTERLRKSKIKEEAMLTCDSFAIPLPDKDIVWSFEGNKILENDKFSIKKATKVDGIVSSLIIKETESEDFGDYKCSIDNDFGKDSLIVKCRRKTHME